MARRAQLSLDGTAYYHCIARCVRRAFLCGEDYVTGKNFDHRRQWLVNRLKQQASVFSIDICAYALMGNHYHLVLRVDTPRAMEWSDREVIERWTKLFRGPVLIQQYLSGDSISNVELETVSEIARVWRRRLSDLSWFMRCVNEYIARKANTEDDCRGRFWEGRFKSRALLDNTALVSCMVYVDLNPIRAGVCGSIEMSDYTSIQERWAAARGDCKKRNREPVHGRPMLVPLSADSADNTPGALPFNNLSYIELVSSTGRAVVAGDGGNFAPAGMGLIGRFELSASQWIELATEIHSTSITAIGNSGQLDAFLARSGRKWMHGKRTLQRIYSGTSGG